MYAGCNPQVGAVKIYSAGSVTNGSVSCASDYVATNCGRFPYNDGNGHYEGFPTGGFSGVSSCKCYNYYKTTCYVSCAYKWVVK